MLDCIWNTVQFWAPNIRKMLINYKFSRRPPQWQGLEHLPHEERLRELGWEKRWLWGHRTAACSYLWGGYGEDRARLFTVVHGRRMTDGGHKLKQQKFRLVTGKSFLNIRTIKFWNMVPREAGNPGRFFKTWLDKALSNLI